MTILDGSQAGVAVIVVAAGAGVRLGSGPPKALRPLGGEPMLLHALRRVTASPMVGCVVVVAPPGREAVVRELAAGTTGRGELRVVTGGAERQRSVAAGLAALPPGFEVVLVHDAARALAPRSLLEEVAGAVLAGHDAVIPVMAVTDTITRVDASGDLLDYLDRSTLRAVQTPQGFRRAVLAKAHAAASGDVATDDAGLVARLGGRVHTVPGSAHALKITTQRDLAVAETLLGPPPATRTLLA